MAVVLFLLSPFVGEFLLGNLTLSQLWLYPVLVLLYGSGALLIREVVRRYGGGWPRLAVLAVAYALIEEGPVDQLLWNHAYSGVDYVSGATEVPFLGLNVNTVLTIVALHAVWSICVPIALVESLASPGRRTAPFLSRSRLVGVGLLYVVGCVFVGVTTWQERHFMASFVQLLSCWVVIALVVVAAFTVRLPRVRALAAPSPSVVLLFGLLVTSLWWGPQVLSVGGEWLWTSLWVATVAVAVVLVPRWSASASWSPRHVAALAVGAGLTYAWGSFPVQPEDSTSTGLDLAGNVVFVLIFLTVAVLAWRRARDTARPASPQPA